MELAEQRDRMVDFQLARRGIQASGVLEAFRRVPREDFLPTEMAEFAYRDAPLPIGDRQTISQPYIVALTIEALRLRGGERVLEVGTGSGYAAAILSVLAKEVITVERIGALAETARARLKRLGYDNVEVYEGDGTTGFPPRAPYDAIAVAAGGPEVPRALMNQLVIGGRLVIPVGPTETQQVLMLVTRDSESQFREERICEVHFVPLIGEHGWPETERMVRAHAVPRGGGLPTLVRENAEPFAELDSTAVDALVERVAGARLVLLGESTHGTSEFYRMRARITQRLIEKQGFRFVAVEADWPDAARINDYVLGDARSSGVDFTPFSRFPTWMWRNEEVLEFVEWLRERNLQAPARELRVGFHGLDLYSMFTSIAAVLHYLDDVDPAAARVARARYGSLTPWQKDPAEYGRAVLVGRYTSSEEAVVSMLTDMLERRLDYARRDGARFFDASRNAALVASAEGYYRAMYYASQASWNLRDSHMFETLRALLGFYGAESRGVVWAHNSHVGNALATEMGARGELNVGQLVRVNFGEGAYIVGFGTDHGTVAAASDWEEPVQRMRVRPAHVDSYERVFHRSEVPACFLHLREPRRRVLRDELLVPRLERAIGVVYRPETEMQSHYFHASLPRQFDEFIWFDETQAVTPLAARAGGPTRDLPETFPFGI